jgi:cytochrome P450
MTTDVEFDPFTPEFRADPYPAYAHLRSSEPVHWSGHLNAWVLTRYADVSAALRDPRFSASARIRGIFEGIGADVRADLRRLEAVAGARLGMMDPPEHTRLKALLARALSPRVLATARPRIQQTVDRLLDTVATAGTMDAIRDLAYPLPAAVMLDLLGVPPRDHALVLRWSRDLVVFLATGDGGQGPALARQAEASVGDFEAYMAEIVAERRRRPQPDLIGALVALHDRADGLSQTELLASIGNMLTAGHEPTSAMIGNGLLALLRHPDVLARLLAEPSLIPPAIEELLRYDAPAQFVARTATEDVVLGGRVLRRGDAVRPALGAANRDPERFPDPDRLDITRRGAQHDAFAFGIHFCLGARLARLEAEVVFTTVLRRLPDLRRAAEAIAYGPNIGIRCPISLPVRFTPSPDRGADGGSD